SLLSVAAGSENWLVGAGWGTAPAENFQLETVFGGELAGDVAEGQRLSDIMAKAARSDPADHLTVVPYRLVTDAVGIGCVHHEADPAALGARLLLPERRLAPNATAPAQNDAASPTASH